MEIIYVSGDEVNQALAEELAPVCGATVYRSHPGDSLPNGRRFGAVLYDLDAVEPRDRPEFLERILSERRTRPTAVHGYQITDEQAARLRRRGIGVAQRLRTELFQALCRAARWSLAAVPPDDALADETWIALDA